jgi:hypothetical protein
VATILSALLGEIVDAAIIAVIVLFCAVLSFVQEYRADNALKALRKMLAPTIRVLRDGAEARVPSRELVPGDIMLLEAGDRIPADARLAEIHSLKCDEAPLTGESFPVEKSLSPAAKDAAAGDRRNVVYAGTTVTYGRGKAIVTSTGMHTEFGQIAEQVATASVEPSPLEKRTAEVGRWLGIIALVVCAVTIAVSVVRAWMGNELNLQLVLTMTMFAIALAVAAVPEALACHRDRCARRRHARDGEAQRARAAHAGGRDARVHDGDLLGQDGDAHQRRDDGAPPLRRWPRDRGRRRRLLTPGYFRPAARRERRGRAAHAAGRIAVQRCNARRGCRAAGSSRAIPPKARWSSWQPRPRSSRRPPAPTRRGSPSFRSARNASG